MTNNKIVVALGRNAFGTTFPEQQKNPSLGFNTIFL